MRVWLWFYHILEFHIRSAKVIIFLINKLWKIWPIKLIYKPLAASSEMAIVCFHRHHHCHPSRCCWFQCKRRAEKDDEKCWSKWSNEIIIFSMSIPFVLNGNIKSHWLNLTNYRIIHFGSSGSSGSSDGVCGRLVSLGAFQIIMCTYSISHITRTLKCATQIWCLIPFFCAKFNLKRVIKCRKTRRQRRRWWQRQRRQQRLFIRRNVCARASACFKLLLFIVAIAIS